MTFEKISESKRAFRRRLAQAPIAEKLRMLDLMRERALTLGAAKPRRTATAREQPPRYRKQS